MLGIEFVQNFVEKKPFPRAMKVTESMISIAQHHGLLVYPAGAGSDGVNGDAVMIAPFEYYF